MNPAIQFFYPEVNIPVDANPIAERAFNFYMSRGIAEKLSEGKVAKKEEWHWKKIIKLVSNETPNSFDTIVAAIASFRRKKYEVALFFTVRAIMIDPYNTFASRLFFLTMTALRYADLEPMYFSHAAKGAEEVRTYLLEFAKKHFEKDEFAMCDFYVQRANDIASITGEQPTFLVVAGAQTKRHIDAGDYDEHADEMLKNQHELIRFEDEKAVNRFTKRWEIDPNKILLAEKVSGLIDGNKICVELGCHSGMLLSMIQEKCKGSPRLIGIDPDKEAIKLGRKKFKKIEFFQGDDLDLAEGTFFNDKFDVLLLSDICLLLKGENISQIFEFAKDKCRHIVIMDDVLNMDGDFSVLRRVYFLHPFRKMLEENGFKIIEKTFPPNPNWANTGILIAEKK